MGKLFANNGDPDQTPRSAASDLGLHGLPSTLLRVSRLQWVNGQANNESFRSICATPDLNLSCLQHYTFTLRKQTYSNILRILPTKNENFQKNNSGSYHLSAQNIDCGYLLEPPRRGGSNKYPQPMFLSRNKYSSVYSCM